MRYDSHLVCWYTRFGPETQLCLMYYMALLEIYWIPEFWYVLHDSVSSWDIIILWGKWRLNYSVLLFSAKRSSYLYSFLSCIARPFFSDRYLSVCFHGVPWTPQHIGRTSLTYYDMLLNIHISFVLSKVSLILGLKRKEEHTYQNDKHLLSSSHK